MAERPPAQAFLGGPGLLGPHREDRGVERLVDGAEILHALDEPGGQVVFGELRSHFGERLLEDLINKMARLTHDIELCLGFDRPDAGEHAGRHGRARFGKQLLKRQHELGGRVQIDAKGRGPVPDRFPDDRLRVLLLGEDAHRRRVAAHVEVKFRHVARHEQ